MAKIQPDAILKAIGRVKGGISVRHNKITADSETVRIPVPDKVTLPMLQHTGDVCTPTVKKGDYVCVGQVVGDSDSYTAVPVHASVSGKVISTERVRLANGTRVPAVTIKSDGKMTPCNKITPPSVNTKAELVQAIRASGLVGLGGSGYPTHLKLDVPDSLFVDTLIINAAECEPYITTDYRECIENSWDIMSGVFTLLDIYGFSQVIIAVEDNKPEAIRILKEIADSDLDHGNKIRLMTLKSRYPQGAERLMVLSCTGRTVPEGKISPDAGCLVLNVSTVAFISRYLKTGKPLTSRTVTVSGKCIRKPMNVRVPIGTSIQDIIDFCGGFSEAPHKVLSGGPMMGTALSDTDVPLVKSNNAIIAFSSEGARIKPERACIHCGRCHLTCPMSLMPLKIAEAAKKGKINELAKLGTHVCMECGCCAYSCPAGRPLVEEIRLAKEALRKAGAK